MKHNLIILFIGCTLLLSCEDSNTIYEVGQDFIESNTRVFQVDTLTLATSTIISDSLVTSGTTRILIGALQDNDFGNLTAQSNFSLSSLTYDLDKAAVFDSISLVLFYDRYYYGDTTQVQTYTVHEIIEVFEPNNDDTYFYNTSSLKYSEVILGQQSFTPYPNKKDSINIKLDDSFGKNIFDKIVANEITDVNDLNKEFRGLTITSDPNINNVLGFKYSTFEAGSTVMKLYYTLKDDDDAEDNQYFLEFRLEGGNKIFNNISSDRSNTVLSSLIASEDVLSSTETGNKNYLQSGTGISMRVEMPTLTTLNELENNGTSLSATLKMYPDYASYSNKNLIDSLAVYVIDNKNRSIKQLYSLEGDIIYAKLNSDNSEFDANTYYTVDLTSLVDEILTSSYTLNYALRFEFPDNSKTINRLLIYDDKSPENSDFKMQLLLTYLSY